MDEAIKIFRMVATEFVSMSDRDVEKWLELTAPLISKKVFGKLYLQALVQLTAHKMKMAGYGDTNYGTIGDALRIGSYSEGGTSVSFTANPGSSPQSNANLALTQYGLEYLSIRRLVVVPIRLSGENK